MSWLFQPFPAAQSAPSGDMIGSASFAFTGSGALRGSGRLIGATTMTFTATGTLIDRRRSLLYRPRAAQLMPLMHY